MNFMPELQQHEDAWLAYGKRRASRLRWRKATNADVAATLNVAELTKKIEVHDKRVWIARAWVRLFTSIERQREMLVYCLGRDVLFALKASPVPSTLSAQQVNLDKLAAVAKRASRFSWFKKPLNAFMGWVREKIGSAVVVSEHQPAPSIPVNPDEPHAEGRDGEPVLPVVLDTPEALARFHEKKEQDLCVLKQLYKHCSDHLYESETSLERLNRFDVCFKPYKDKLRELQLYYHPDKATPRKAKEAGLTDETFLNEVTAAFTRELQPQYAMLEEKRIAIKDRNNDSVELDRRIIEARQERIIATEQTAKRRAELEVSIAEYKIYLEQSRKEKEAREAEREARHCTRAQLSELKGKLAAVETAILAKKSHSTSVLNHVGHDSNGAVVPPENVTCSSNPNTLFAMNSVPVEPAAEALNNVSVFTQPQAK
jgi:hypothetical protein